MIASPPNPRYQKFVRDVGKRIAHLRTERHWTLEQLAEKSGLAAITVSRVEAGQTDFTLGTMVHFANAFNIPLAEIFRGVELDETS